MLRCLRKSRIPACNHSTLSHRNHVGYLGKGKSGGIVPERATIQPVSSGRKPVIVRKLSREWLAGYSGVGLAAAESAMELLEPGGRLLRVNWSEIKWVCQVRELPSGATVGNESSQPERLLRKRFSSRPRTAGLWLRLKLADGDELEGLAANDLSLVEGVALQLTPPDTRSNTQRILIPREAVRELEVVAVIGKPKSQQSMPAGMQPELFPEDE
jgi:hypothetical protein